MWSDYINFLSKLTFKRAINALGLVFGYIYSKITKTPVNGFLPVALAIEPTTSCNLRCPECPSGLRSFTRPTGMLETKLFENVITELKDALMYLTFYFQGEPYLHKDFLEMVKFASNNGIYTSTSTNAHYLNYENAKATIKSGLDRVIISLDGTTQDTYQQYRIGGSLDKVIEGTKNLIAAKRELNSSTPHIIFQFLVVKPNEHQIAEAKDLSKTLGVDEIRFKTAQIYDYENGSGLIPENDKYARYKKNTQGKYEIKNKLLNHCWKMWHSAVITWDGLVVPCCFDKDAEYRMGNVSKSSFKDVWMSEKYLSFRKQLIGSRKNIEMCKNCTEGTKIWG
ncbi:SPASM domain-containing protein [Lacihabitans sp. CS3-21]|uniref:SPASM domain-containing protein n=1 Tax=Lacihabitans sp. CS3-21 TaxID=2487332 RepID=UPI0020CE7160|nr:SPASM domain-containing protein [Lacihabitans sp. CS3-21]MCP9749338.1 radical SAM protein [Lacihabitans sp. CS3-21]